MIDTASRRRGRPPKRFCLRSKDRKLLQEVAHSHESARAQKRALALLDLDRDEPLDRVAVLLGVTRQSVSNWRDAWIRNSRTSRRLEDQERTGRPAQWTEERQEALEAMLERSPEEAGYRARSWTARLLSNHLGRCFGWKPSERSVRLQLKGLGYVYKRPRYVLEPDPQLVKKSP